MVAIANNRFANNLTVLSLHKLTKVNRINDKNMVKK